MRIHWHGMHWGNLEVHEETDGWSFDVQVYLGGISPDFVQMQLFADRVFLHNTPKRCIYSELETIDDLFLEFDTENPTAKETTLFKKLEEFDTYIRNNAGFIPNYGERWRYGETISTAFVESTVNQVISKRMVKKQQMRWSRQGAHLLLQVRTRVLNNELQDVFSQWHPNFNKGEEYQRKAA